MAVKKEGSAVLVAYPAWTARLGAAWCQAAIFAYGVPQWSAVPENLRKSGRRKNAPNPLFHSCFIKVGFTHDNES